MVLLGHYYALGTPVEVVPDYQSSESAGEAICGHHGYHYWNDDVSVKCGRLSAADALHCDFAQYPSKMILANVVCRTFDA